MATGADAVRMFRSFVKRAKKRDDDFDLDTSLFADGIGLDSLETAELSALLEDELGSDPFSDGEMPNTVAELAAFYDEKSAS